MKNNEIENIEPSILQNIDSTTNLVARIDTSEVKAYDSPTKNKVVSRWKHIVRADTQTQFAKLNVGKIVMAILINNTTIKKSGSRYRSIFDSHRFVIYSVTIKGSFTPLAELDFGDSSTDLEEAISAISRYGLPHTVSRPSWRSDFSDGSRCLIKPENVNLSKANNLPAIRKFGNLCGYKYALYKTLLAHAKYSIGESFKTSKYKDPSIKELMDFVAQKPVYHYHVKIINGNLLELNRDCEPTREKQKTLNREQHTPEVARRWLQKALRSNTYFSRMLKKAI